MKSESTVYPQEVEMLQGKKLVNFLIEEKTRVGMDGTEYKYYEYEQRHLPVDAQQIDVDKLIARETKIIVNKRKDEALGRLTVKTSSGKVFYADAMSRADISDEISIAIDTGITSIIWKLAEDINGQRIVEVTLDELKEARQLAMAEKATIVGIK